MQQQALNKLNIFRFFIVKEKTSSNGDVRCIKTQNCKTYDSKDMGIIVFIRKTN
jgi:hypothetical protein